MKKTIVILVLGALTVCLVPAAAQVHEWQTVSTMQGSGSAYASQVTPVGASSVMDNNSTNESQGVPSGRSIRRSGSDEWGDNQEGGGDYIDTGSPVGDAVLPLMLMAAMAGGVIYLRRRKQVVVVE